MIIQASKRLAEVQEYYFSQKLRQIQQLEMSQRKVINLGIGNPDMCPSENTIAELVRAAQNPYNHGYQSYRGISELRKSISCFYKSLYHVTLEPETEILPLLGSKEGITHISLAFLDAGDCVLAPDPGYPTYSSVTKMAGGKVLYYNLFEKNNWLPDLKELKSVISGRQRKNFNIKLLWLNYPHMPTGTEANDECFSALIALARQHKILLCHDNPYSMVLNHKKTKSILNYKGANEVAIELNSLSKSHNMAGWRIGWIAGKKEYIDTILKVKSNVDSGMFLPIQKAAAQALSNPPSWHNARNEEYARRRKKVWELLDMLGCEYTKNQVGMFVWAKIKNHGCFSSGERRKKISSEEFVEKILAETNVFITPGFIFGKNGEGYVRVSMCSKEDVIQEAIDRVKMRFLVLKILNQ